jgi:hypothetical protein
MTTNAFAVLALTAWVPDPVHPLVQILAFLVLTALAVLAGRRVRHTRHRAARVAWAVGCCLLVAMLLPFLAPSVARVRDAGPEAVLAYRLKQIALAMHSYADAHGGRLPPAAVFDKEGRPLLSWRVLLLPYVDQNELFRQFRLDEPWDSPHNLALLPRMPEVYAPPDEPGLRVEPHATFYQAFVGEGTAFEGKVGLRIRDDFPDGTSDTILVAEAAEAVPWTKPADLAYAKDRPLPKLGGVFAGKPAHVALADGSVRPLPPDLSEGTLRDAVTRNDGRKLGPDW